MASLTIDIATKRPPTRDGSEHASADALPRAKSSKTHPTKANGNENASLFFVGTATTILEWEGLRLMTDPNFLHAGDHVHLGPGVTGTRKTNPAVDLHELPPVDMVLLSHYHADHFDQHVEATLRRDLPIISTPHAHKHLSNKDPASESFTAVYPLDAFETKMVDLQPIAHDQQNPRLKVTAMPGKHVPPGPFNIAGLTNDFLQAVPPTNGWILELGYSKTLSTGDTYTGTSDHLPFQCGYRIYISGDTLLVDDLKQIPDMYTDAGETIDLMLIHLGGTTIPGPSLPLLMVTMDADMGIKLINLVRPDLTIPIHYDDYDVFMSPLSDFQKAVSQAGLDDKVVYLDRGDEFRFQVRQPA